LPKLFPALVGLSLKRRLGLPLLFDMRGFWADEKLEGGSWPQRNPLFRPVYRFFKRQEAQLLATSDAIVSLTEAGRNEMVTNYADLTPIRLASSRELMALGVPIVANAGVGEVAEVLKTDHAGAVVSTFDPLALAQAAEQVLELSTSAAAIRQAALRRFRLGDGVARYDAIYRSIGKLRK
jgi:hypothetical protein